MKYPGYVYNSYSTAAVSGKDQVGGLLGRAFCGTVTNSYSIGKVENGGGFMGNNYAGGAITNCYWNKQTSGQTSSSGGTGYTTSEMAIQSNYKDWDFSTIWIMGDDGYPKLRTFGDGS